MPPSTDVLATIPVDKEPRWVTIAPDGRRAYVTLEDVVGGAFRGGLAVIDTATSALVTTIDLGHPSGVVVAPDGRRAYVPAFEGGRGVVSVIDTATNGVVDTIAVSGQGAFLRVWRSRPTGATSTSPPRTRRACPKGRAR
jgi:YVTN family beta-propeller protein